jgi:hypothetical protein
MAQHPQSTGFGEYLKEAILAARFPTPTHFARAVGTDPSVVLRWLSESGVRPSARRALHRAGKTMNEVVLATRTSSTAGRPTPGTHRLAQNSTDSCRQSPIPQGDRQALESVLDRILDPYRKVMRRRRSA